MSGIQPFFLTGANAKIRVNGVTLAFVTDLSYGITVNHRSPVVLGMYEPSSIEPVSYKVSGQFTLVRYVADAANNTKAPKGVSEKGNGLGYWGKPNDLISRIKKGFDIKSGGDGQVYDNLNPSKLQTSAMFDMEIFQKIGGNTLPVSKLRNCRIVRAEFKLTKKGAAIQSFAFEAIYADEDSFIADSSGRGQQFA